MYETKAALPRGRRTSRWRALLGPTRPCRSLPSLSPSTMWAREAQERLHTTLREGEENKWVDQMIAKAWENIKTPQDHTL